MLKRNISFKNLDDETISRDFYFNLTVPEVSELEYGISGGIAAHWTRMVEEKNAAAMLREFKNLISKAYGERSEDGVTFLKFDPITGASLGTKFLQTNAYATLFMELLGPDTSDSAFTEFLKGCLPPELVEKMGEMELPVRSSGLLPEIPPEERTSAGEFSEEELLAMDQDEFDKVAGTDPKAWSRTIMLVAFKRKSIAQSTATAESTDS